MERILPYPSQSDEALRRARAQPRVLDWRHAKVSDTPRPCVLCRRPALLIDPDTAEPKHKICAEAQLGEALSRDRLARAGA
jgi:hypothetical protein